LKQDTQEEEKKNNDLNEIDLSGLSIEELIELYTNVTTSENWFRNHKQVQKINTAFEEKFHADLEANKKTFIEEGRNEIDFYFKPEYKKKFDQIGYDYRKKEKRAF